MQKSLLSLAAAVAVAFGSSAAMAAPTFQVQEGSIAGTPTDGFSTFTADSFGSKYDERIQITSATTFDSTAYFNNFVFANTNVSPIGVSNYLGINEAQFGGVGYNLYGTFTSSGTYVTDGFGNTTFVGTTGKFEIWSDAKQDTTLGYTAGSINVNVGAATSDDRLLASSDVLVSALGELKPSDQAGGYALQFGDLELTTDGKAYFFSPDPFYAFARATGQFDSFVLPGVNGIAVITGGSLDGTFHGVPEPTSVALLGLGLAGLGLTQRRRKAAAK